MSGEFAWTVTFTDIETTWTEMRSVWHKLSPDVKDAVDDVSKCLPFDIGNILAFYKERLFHKDTINPINEARNNEEKEA